MRRRIRTYRAHHPPLIAHFHSTEAAIQPIGRDTPSHRFRPYNATPALSHNSAKFCETK